MRFFGTPYMGGMSYREASRTPERGGNEPTRQERCTPSQRRENGTGMNEENLLRLIQRLDFVKVELELYLDGYPECQSALRYYREIVGKLKDAKEEYETKYGPLTADSTHGDTWLWVKGKWPWQMDEWRM